MTYPEPYVPVAISYIINYIGGSPHMLLAVRRENGRVTTPGGQLEPGETARKAARREIIEEAGLTVCLNEILTISRASIKTRIDGMNVFANTFLIYYKDRHGQPVNREPDKHSKWGWVPVDQVDWDLAHFEGFPSEIFFSGGWLERIDRHGARHKLLY